GGHESRSPIWQAFLLAEYVATLAVLRADNDDVPVWGRKRVKGMADCLARLAHPDGQLPEFGPTPIEGTWPVCELLATAAALLHEPAFAQTPGLPGVWPLLLLGESGRRTYASLSRGGDVVPTARALRRTGFYVLAGGAGDVMVLDGGSQSCADGAATFGYELAVGGLPLVVGSRVGVEEDGPLAEHARSRRARNVLVPGRSDGGPGGDVEGRFTVRDGVQYFLGTARHFAGLGDDVQYRRRVFCLPGRFWLVCDELLGTGTGTFSGETLVHLHPDVSVRAGCAGKPIVTVARTPASSLSILAAGVRSLGLAGGVTGPYAQGWYASSAGEWSAAPVVVVRVAGKLPLTVGYALVPRAGGAAIDLTVESDAFELRAGLRLADCVYELRAVQDEVGLVIRPT
ncbi:MAG: heparinase II/III domain-containing protein, partial [Gemmatimonadales bacterium]